MKKEEDINKQSSGATNLSENRSKKIKENTIETQHTKENHKENCDVDHIHDEICDHTNDQHDHFQNENNNTTNDDIKNLQEDKDLFAEDFLSYQEINNYLLFMSRGQSMSGFRKGTIPLAILHAKNPQIVDNLINFYHHMKNIKLQTVSKYSTVQKLVETGAGFRIVYDFHDIPKADKQDQHQTEVYQAEEPHPKKEQNQVDENISHNVINNKEIKKNTKKTSKK